ncbi:MAG: hypothetical protein HETSPECPRED_010130 [Heterodermia speciosa]|uniref:DUF1989 domain-containing protein n=1 Tax=Heterodermia speciosa TaxID=116794 RepID=A0A8H3ESL1_9LECA|nr:MAG: hypothetical protein HETSPECPRED_010130 [Heterodermia speciosa]
MHLIPARHAQSVCLTEGQRLRVYNPSGTQVVDFFAFSPSTLAASTDASTPKRLEFLSLAHTRISTLHLMPHPGDILVSNLYRPMLTITRDTWIDGGGTHDTLISACDEIRYRKLGVKFPQDPVAGEGHRSCAMNLEEELCNYLGKDREGQWSGIETPSPLNLFMNVPWTSQSEPTKPSAVSDHNEPVEPRKIHVAAPNGPSGSFVEFEAAMDLLVVMSACPNDMSKTNGEEMICKDAGFEALN